MNIRMMRRWAAVVGLALATGCGGAGGGVSEPVDMGTVEEAPPATPDGLWMVPDQYAGQGGSVGGKGSDYAEEGSFSGAGGATGGAGEPAPGDDGGSGGGGATGGNGAPPQDVNAGVADDNASFEAFLSYLDKNANLPNTLPIDVSERYVLRVAAGGKAVANARVRISVGEQLVFEGRTLATGELLFHPWAAGVAADATRFSWQVNAAAGTSSGTFDRTSGGSPVELEAAGPNPQAAKVRADIALVVDTTGSMGDEITVLRDSWLNITAQIAKLDPNLDPRFALVVYRDHGDAYVVKYLDFTDDVQEFLAALEDLEAGGGGDYPEDLQAALDVTMQYLSWDSEAPIRIAFTLADAPPQLYEQETTYPESLNRAVRRGVRTHAIAASGSDESAEHVFRQIAQFTAGRFLFLTYDNDIPGKPGSGTGSGGDDGYSVEDYLTGTLDELVVKLVNLDVLALTGKPLPQTQQ